ncbi:MAG: T9SS type A sorting domain-containing protein, partial [Ferruginibacter sp.]
QVKTKTGYITVFANPLPVISAADRLLTCNINAATYQWFLNNNPIANATQQTYNAIQDGNYTVSVVDANGCNGLSAAIGIPVAPVNTITGVQVFPIPSNGIIYITSGDIKGTARMKLYNSIGALVMERTISDLSLKNEINISTLAAGVYEMKLFTEQSVFVRKIQRN